MWSKWSFLIFQEFPVYAAKKLCAISEADTTAVLCREDSVVLFALNTIATKILKWSHDSQVSFWPHFFVFLEKNIINVFHMKVKKDVILHEGVPSSWCSEDLCINSNKITALLTYALRWDTDTCLFVTVSLSSPWGGDKVKILWHQEIDVTVNILCNERTDLYKTAWKIYSVFFVVVQRSTIHSDLARILSWVLC